MKKIALLMGVFALAGCGAEAPTEEAPTEEVAATYADGPGTYTRTSANADGITEVIVTTVSADGTYLTTTDGVETGAGTATFDGANICFDWEANEEGAACWVNGPMGEDGSFETTAPDGKTHTIQMTPPAAE